MCGLPWERMCEDTVVRSWSLSGRTSLELPTKPYVVYTPTWPSPAKMNGMACARPATRVVDGAAVARCGRQSIAVPPEMAIGPSPVLTPGLMADSHPRVRTLRRMSFISFPHMRISCTRMMWTPSSGAASSARMSEEWNVTFMVKTHRSSFGLVLCPSPWKPRVWFQPRVGPHPEHHPLGLWVGSDTVNFAQTTRVRWWGVAVCGMFPICSAALFSHARLSTHVGRDNKLERCSTWTIQKAWSGSGGAISLCVSPAVFRRAWRSDLLPCDCAA